MSAHLENQQTNLMRTESGTIKSADPLVSFFYLLIRDHMPAGVVEKVLDEVLVAKGKNVVFTNGWLAQYSMNIAKRLQAYDKKLNDQNKEDQVSENKTTEVLIKKQPGEIFFQEAARRIGVSESTFRGWKRINWIPTHRRIGGYVVKASICEKIKTAINAHGKNWAKKISFTLDDVEFSSTADRRVMIDPRTDVADKPTNCANAVCSDQHKYPRLAKIAKELQSLGESELFHRVSARVVQLMP